MKRALGSGLSASGSWHGVAGTCIVTLCLTACGTTALRAPLPEPGADAVPLVVFCDSFHSGILVRKADLGLDLDPNREGAAITAEWWTIHYGEVRWMIGQDNSTLHAVSLFIRPLPGGLQINHSTPALAEIPLDVANLRTWTFTISRSDLERMRDRLSTAWLGPIIFPRPHWDTTLTVATPHDWSVWRNCHDFTIDLLDAAGIHLAQRHLYLAGGFVRDLDDACREAEHVQVE